MYSLPIDIWTPNSAPRHTVAPGIGCKVSRIHCGRDKNLADPVLRNKKRRDPQWPPKKMGFVMVCHHVPYIQVCNLG